MTKKLFLDDLINEAISKVKEKNESSICRFIPVKSGGYMHHFTLKKMKHNRPEELYGLIQAHIIQIENPQQIQAKPVELEQLSTYKKKRLFTITETEMN